MGRVFKEVTLSVVKEITHNPNPSPNSNPNPKLNRFHGLKGKRFNCYSTDPDPQQEICRMRLITTSNADGEEAPLFFVVKCSEKEMGDTPMELLKIPGLAPGGTTCRGMNQEGYVLFVRQGETDTDESLEEAIFRMVDLYQVRPFISDIRKRRFGWDGDKESLTPEMTCNATCDGAFPQVAYLTSDDYIEWAADYLVLRTKHHASRTSVEQMQDLAKKYANIKRLLKQAVGICGTTLSFRKAIEAVLKASGKVRMTDTHKRLILDALCQMPEITAKAITAKDNIKVT